MDFIWKLIVSLTLSTSMLTGTTPVQKRLPAQSHMVVQVQVREQAQGLTMNRRYLEPEKIESVLCYLRSLPGGEATSEDPERYAGSDYKLTLQFSDGRQQTVYQHADRWISENGHPWKEIPAEEGAVLGELLRVLPGDRRVECR